MTVTGAAGSPYSSTRNPVPSLHQNQSLISEPCPSHDTVRTTNQTGLIRGFTLPCFSCTRSVQTFDRRVWLEPAPCQPPEWGGLSSAQPPTAKPTLRASAGAISTYATLADGMT